ncbi:MAG: hypothetical protein JO068_17900, partial [Hyphomicrobiales bacterium]|nr:hypothetical protein [Hyphomicrobiales bacterium]
AAHAGSPVTIPANMLPQGGHFVSGTGSIGTQGLTETITQTSQRGIIDFSRIYNGTTSSSGTPTFGTLFGGDTASFSQAFLSKDVLGSGKSTLRASGSVTITPASLIVNAVSDSRIYNGTTSSAGAPTFGTLFGTDSASFSQAFLSKDVLGTGKSTLRASGSVNDGNGGQDYAITFMDAAGTITPASLIVNAVGDSRIYNGSTSSAGTPSFGTLFGTDTASFSQAFLSKDVLGTGKSTLRASGSVNDGNGGKDYAITFVDAAGTITPATLTISAVSDTKIFDGTTGSTALAQVTGLKGDDSVTGLAERFDSINAGHRSLSFGPLTVNDGNGGANYILSILNPTASGAITPASLTITANNATAVQGGPQPAFSASFSGFPAGLGSGTLTGTITFTVTAVPGMPGSFEVLPGGLSSANFTIAFVPGTLLLTGGNNQPVDTPMNASNPASSSAAPTTMTGGEISTTGSDKTLDFSLPPVLFSLNYYEFIRTNGLLFLDPSGTIRTSSETGGSGADTGNLRIPSLDEEGKHMGTLIGFNSTFIEICRARAALCR